MEVYKTCLLLVFLVIVAGGIFDLGFYLNGEATISEWLQANPLWFFIPALLMLLFILALMFHLFVLPPKWGGV
jgi:uncharacterized membrane protein YbhN (UPF0104 family)